MKAIVQKTYASADVLQLRDVDAPVAGDRAALVRVHAASAHARAWHFMTGLPYLFCIAGTGLRAPKGPAFGTRMWPVASRQPARI